jgi:hypothetical protein
LRYLQVPTYSFTDTYGRVLSVKEMREIPEYSVAFTMNKAADEDLDEIASRPYVYGSGGERDTYKLYEVSLAKLLDARFDMSRLSKVAVPT